MGFFSTQIENYLITDYSQFFRPSKATIIKELENPGGKLLPRITFLKIKPSKTQLINKLTKEKKTLHI